MGLTYHEAKVLGIGDEHPDSPGRRDARSQAPKDGMNKMEREFFRRARDYYCDQIGHEPFRLLLAGKTTYLPDFVTQAPRWLCRCTVNPELMGEIRRYLRMVPTCWEVKGFMRDDASVKLKVAAELYPMFDFVLVTKEERKWVCRTVDRQGIGLEKWTPEWLA